METHSIRLDISNTWLSYINHSLGYSACVNHGGVILLPKNTVQQDVINGKLRTILPQYQSLFSKENSAIQLKYAKESSKAPKVKAVIGHIMDCNS